MNYLKNWKTDSFEEKQTEAYITSKIKAVKNQTNLVNDAIIHSKKKGSDVSGQA